MRHIKIYICGLSAWVSAALLLCGCSADDITDPDAGTADGSVKSYVSLTFVQSSGSGTRANPTGGDSRQKGEEYENAINSAVAFFYQPADGKGVNTSENTEIAAVVSFDNIKQSGADGTTPTEVDKIYTTETKSVDMENGTYHVIVVANPGTDWWSTTESLTLKDVRDHIQTTAWTENNGNYSDFLMSSEEDATLELNSNPANDPAEVSVTVERMAARLDYKTENSYTCTDPNYSDATVTIEGAALVNNLIAGSYLLKRVAAKDNTSSVTYLGDEEIGTNYVLDPWTLQKTATTSSFTGIEGGARGLYGEAYYNSGSQDPNWWADYVKKGTAMSDGFNRIGYTLENTTLADNTSKAYNTGVVFKATFHLATGSISETYKDGDTFFAWGTSLYASIEDMMTHLYGRNIFNDFDKSIEACESWDALNTFITNTLKENDPSGYYNFLSTQYKENNSKNNFGEVKESLKWTTYMKNVCGYSKAEDGITLDDFGQTPAEGHKSSTREALKPYGVSTYEDATCYYTWWVRHSNDDSSGESSATDDNDIDDDGNGVMEYAIVRNNIYKLTVESVYGLGGDVPGDNSLRVNVYVNDWLLLDDEYLNM